MDPIVIVLDGSMLQHADGPFFWMIKFSGVLHYERKGELMILNSNGDENGASTVKGGGLCVERVGNAAVSIKGDDQP